MSPTTTNPIGPSSRDLREARKRVGLTRAALAGLADCSVSTPRLHRAGSGAQAQRCARARVGASRSQANARTSQPTTKLVNDAPSTRADAAGDRRDRQSVPPNLSPTIVPHLSLG